jgi:peroxiredoxin
MKTLTTLILTLFVTSSFALTSGTAAPEFKLMGVKSKKEVSLSDYKGKIVVLEWLNHGCPFIRKHYDSGNMQSLQKKYTAQGIVWLSVISSAKGQQGHVEADQGLKDMETNHSNATDVLLDPTGEVGKKYEAKTTPHMFVIDAKGMLAYQGAIDDHADADQASVKIAKNYVSAALAEVAAGKKVTQPATKSYGCSVKY